MHIAVGRHSLSTCIAGCILILVSQSGWTSNVTVEITYPGSDQSHLENAFVYLVPETPAPRRSASQQAALVQEDRQYHPYTQVVRVGDSVTFPNRDVVAHHVYSFSPARVFEIPLYTGEKNPPEVVFDKPGLVVLGCNIHDWMLAFILVIDSPWFSPVKDNGAVIEEVPEGRYSLFFWYPSAETEAGVVRTIDLRDDLSVSIDLLDVPAILNQPEAPRRKVGRREEY